MDGPGANPVVRPALPFRKVNRRGSPGYDPGLQKHHLLPRQLVHLACFRAMIETVGRAPIGFDDFRANGMLLPALGDSARRLALPLHRGPHRCYSAMVIERFGQIERGFASGIGRAAHSTRLDTIFRIALLQRALRVCLLAPRNRAFRLNSRDPVGSGFDFTELDAMAHRLWTETQPDILATSASLAD